MARWRAFRTVAAVALVAGLVALGSGNAWAVLAGRLCATTDLGVVMVADNGNIVTCVFDASVNTGRWTLTPGATVGGTTSTTTVVTTTTVAATAQASNPAG